MGFESNEARSDQSVCPPGDNPLMGFGSDGVAPFISAWSLAARDLMLTGMELTFSDVEALGSEMLFDLENSPLVSEKFNKTIALCKDGGFGGGVDKIIVAGIDSREILAMATRMASAESQIALDLFCPPCDKGSGGANDQGSV